MRGCLLLLAILAWPAAASWAGQAAWYRWESRLEGRVICAQSSPGEGWKRIAGPYGDAACTRQR